MKGIEKCILQASISLAVDCVLLLNKTITLYATVLAEYWIKPNLTSDILDVDYSLLST
jgi:hypothetical protein